MSQKRCDATSVTPHYICKIFTRKKEIFTNFDLFPKSGILRFIGKTKVKFLYIITLTSTIRYPLLPKNEMRFRGSIFLSLSVLLNLSLAIPVFLSIPFRSIMSLAKHLAILDICRATLTPSGYMVGIHVF